MSISEPRNPWPKKLTYGSVSGAICSSVCWSRVAHNLHNKHITDILGSKLMLEQNNINYNAYKLLNSLLLGGQLA